MFLSVFSVDLVNVYEVKINFKCCLFVYNLRLVSVFIAFLENVFIVDYLCVFEGLNCKTGHWTLGCPVVSEGITNNYINFSIIFTNDLLILPFVHASDMSLLINNVLVIGTLTSIKETTNPQKFPNPIALHTTKRR